ncbi:MAG: transcription antitermination factor NusB [Syntrophomonadaceae bacterium]|nr:transcription antitermination factor NusB [Syntrophomonadaceae bacterium]
MSRRKAREVAFKVIYQVDIVKADVIDAFKHTIEEENLPDKDRAFAWQLVSGCLDNIELIDSKISHFSTAWDISRMPSVDRNILRIGAYEILFTDSSLQAIPIDEAIEVAKKYSTDNSPGYINAILDKIKGEKECSI